ncbi:MAG: LysM peptidoglycan-binding domain-containing protein, partial [Anaerolineales bacterium]|nr:LysM peptidoglycan-binding domain-containing protein [Anaerolineales bacterium]
MSPEKSKSGTQICPTCGTRLSEEATRCLVCGSELSTKSEGGEGSAKAVRGSRMPEVTLSLPVAIGLLALFLSIGAALVFFALQETDRIVEPTVTPTITLTITPSITPTPITPTATATPQPSPTPFTYTVAQGDTCLGIAAQFEVSVNSIILLNALGSSCNINQGDQLLIPHPTPTVTPFPTATLSGLEATLAACEKVYYEVQSTDTLSSISINYNVPMEAIKAYNGMVNDTVYEGLTLTIPLCERPSTPGPSPTPTPPPPYSAPELLLPVDGSYFDIQAETITLQWASVGTLNDNEAYQVTVEDLTGGTGRRL